MAPKTVDVLVPVALDRAYTYRVPAGLSLEPGDVVALLGKGQERGQEIAGEVLPFDDRVELAEALRARFGDLAGRR